jgi:glycosyltransferase involved in cell wall biosynthesis
MTAPATVAYVVDGLGLSGKTKAMVDLIAGLDRARFEPSVICFDTEGSPLCDRLRALGVGVGVVACPDGLNLRVVAGLYAALRRLRPDVVHCYNPRTMLYGGVAARALGIRATLGSLSAFACLTPGDDHRFLPQRLLTTSRRNRWRNRAAAGLMRAVVAVSPALGQRFCGYSGVDPRRLRVIPYGVDVARFSRVTAAEAAGFRARHGLPEGAVVVASVGRLVEQKDYQTQLRAFALAAARDPALVMLLVGDGPLRGDVDALARALGIAARVRLAGHCDDVAVALRAADVFVLASKFEPYGVALLEAKAAGAAIVATRVNEVPEILRDPGDGGGATGWLVPPEDPAAMADAFVRLGGDAAARRALGARAARDAAARHGLPAVVGAYQALYDEARRGAVGRDAGAVERGGGAGRAA